MLLVAREHPTVVISRQLWWGHRVPVWYCDDGHTTIAEGRRTRAPMRVAALGGRRRAGHVVLVRALAVRDARLARRTPDLERFYPGDVCSTGRDINFLWVSRMIWAGSS